MVALATAGELGNHLQRTDLDPVVADQALLLASGAVQAYCNWDIAETTETLQVEGSGTVILTLPTLHLTDVTEIRVDGVAIDLTPRPGLSWSHKGQLFLCEGWPVFSLVEADVTHGYNPVPDVVKLIVLEVAARQFNNPLGLVSATTGQVSRTWAGANLPKLSELDQRLLQRFSI